MRIHFTVYLLISLLVLARCSFVDEQVNQSLGRIFKAITSVKTNDNTVCSPLSIYSCFLLVAQGASGDTLEEIQASFGYRSKENAFVEEGTLNNLKTYLEASAKTKFNEYGEEIEGQTIIKMDNSIFINEKFGVKDSYVNTLKTRFSAFAKSLDFNRPSTVTEINQRISESTNGLIKNTLSEVDPSSVSVLVNTLYFKGQWQTPFEETLTYMNKFYKSDQSQVNVKYMFGTEIEGRYLDKNGVKYLALPYKGGKVHFVVEMARDGKIRQPDFDSVRAAASLPLSTLEVQLPRFKAQFKSELKEALRSLGLERIFWPNGDFKEVSDQDVYLSSVVHQAVISVDENGTEAAAATVANMISLSINKHPSIFVDRPFNFHIYDSSTGLVLFSGSIEHPVDA